MSGYCQDCGNTMCLCDEVKADQETYTTIHIQKYDNEPFELLNPPPNKNVLTLPAGTYHFTQLPDEHWEKKINSLKKQLDIALEAVEFYAGDQMIIKQSILAGEYSVRENGDKAREALRKIEAMKKGERDGCQNS